MHLKRWITAIVALPLLIYLVGFGPRWIFYLFLFLLSLAGLNEFYRLVLPDLPLTLKSFAGLLSMSLFLVMYEGYVLILIGIISLLVIVPMLYFLFFNPSKGEKYLSEVGILTAGFIYVCLPIAMFIQIDRLYLIQHPVRGIWIFFLLVVTFANDTGAFYSGKFFGKHKLYESISPKKTWEGSVGGVFLAYIAAIAFLKIFRLHPIDFSIVLLIFLLSVAGQVGDLAESMLKRNYNVKDSGVLLPGHGGVLDRIDSLLFAVPVLYVFLMMSM